MRRCYSVDRTTAEALEVLSLGLCIVTETRATSTASEDSGDPKPSKKPKPKHKVEKNTYGLPTGRPITKLLKQFFGEQAKKLLGTLPEIGAPLPTHFPSLADYNDPMASAMTPILGLYWEESGQKTMGRLGLDPAEWRVTDPHLKSKIEKASLKFCAETNRTTDHQVGRALTLLRQQLIEGIVTEGEGIPLLTKRVQKIFKHAEKYRAKRIAATEASRAVHAAQVESDKQSGVVAGEELLVSADACPLCQMIGAEAGKVRLGQDFAKIGNDPDYSSIEHPPLHPGCQCSLAPILLEAFGGPADSDVDWASTLVDPEPGPEYEEKDEAP